MLRQYRNQGIARLVVDRALARGFNHARGRGPGKRRDWGAKAWLTLGVAGLALLAAARLRPRLDLRGRVAIVTGGGRGLGLAITRALLQRGCRVAICGRDGEVIRRSVEQYQALGFDIIGKACDTSDPEQVRVFVDGVVARYGTVDILVNNAGQCYVGPAAELQPLDMQRALRTIFWVQYHPTMAVLPLMRARGFGRIVNITSIGGKLPLPHQAAYVAGKYAVTGWSETLGVELAHEGIVVSTITPPPLRNGAPLHAHFNGDREAEFAWFARALTSSVSAITAERVARAVVAAIVYGQHERAVSLASWFSARAQGLAPNLMARCLRWIARAMPRTAGAGVVSSMRRGSHVASASHDATVSALAQRSGDDERRYLPASDVARP